MPSPYTQAQCVCSTIGFEHPLWCDTYYPQECPRQWRLAYFMNDFHAVYLPHRTWYQQASRIEALEEEMDAEHDLIIEWPPIETLVSIDTTLDELAPLKTNIKAVVLTLSAVPTSTLATAIQAISKHYSVHLDAGINPHGALVKWAAQQQLNMIRYSQMEPWPKQFGEYQIVRLPCMSLREIKPVLIKLKSYLQSDKRIGIFIEPALQSAERAKQVRSMLELMGLA